MSVRNEVLAAIGEGDVEKLKAVVAADPSVAAGRDESGVSALMQAAYHRRAEMIEVLLSANQPLDVFEAAALGKEARLLEIITGDPALAGAWSSDGFTPLHLAAFFGHPACARLLIEKGAGVNAAATKPGLTVTPLHSAASSRQIGIAEMLLAHGAEVNARQEGGHTALHAAAFHGDRVLAELLLAHGAGPGLRTDDGKSAVDLAEGKGHTALAEFLRKELLTK